MFKKNDPSVLKYLCVLGSAILLISGCQISSIAEQPLNQGSAVKAYEHDQVPSTIEQVGEKDPEQGSLKTWGAIAYIESEDMRMLVHNQGVAILGLGLANNRTTQKEAAQAALTMCEADGLAGCKVRHTFQGECIAIYASFTEGAYTYGLATGKERINTNQQAIAACESHSQGNSCYDFYTLCP